MIHPIPVHDDTIVAYRLTGRLTHADYQAFLPELEALIRERGPLSVLFELHDFKGWELEAAADDLRFLKAHPKDFKRFAIVGKGRLQRWMTALATPFTQAEVRFFEEDRLSEAWDWLRQRELQEHPADSPLRPWQRILVGVEFTPEGQRVVQRALDILEQHPEARVQLLHAVDYPSYVDEAYDPVIPLAIEQQLTEVAEKRLQDLLREIDDARVSGQVVPGTPKRVLLSQAEAWQADLIVLGRHGRGALGRLLGSTASAVIHHARCEVLTVPLEETRQ